jgi:uncharacterized protein involved in outer membrane biogenesis
MTARWRRLLIAGSVAGGAILVVAAGCAAAAPGWIRGTIERVAGAALGRELRIAGGVDVELSLTPSLTASGVTLANASWGSQPEMARVGRARVSVELGSLWSGPLRVRELTVENVRVFLESDGQRANWQFALPARTAAKAAPGELPAVIERASIRDFELTYRPPRGAPPLTAGIRELTAALDPGSRMIDVRGDGRFGGAPWDLQGQIGTLESLLQGRDLDQALTGHIGQSEVTLSGRIHRPWTLGGPNVRISVDGPDIAAALGVLGLRSPLAGPFRLRGAFAPQDRTVGVDLSGAVGGVTASVRGAVDSVLAPETIDASVDARGTHASEIGAWTGVTGLPPVPFDLAGRLRLDGRRLSFDHLGVRVGETSVTVDGPLGELPRCVGADLEVRGTGGDLSQLSALTRVQLPEGPFEITGRFLRRADGLALEGAALSVNDARVHASGTIGEPPRLANLDLTVDAAGPDASCLSGVATIAIPDSPFELRGRVARDGPALVLDAVSGRLGEDVFAGSGRILAARGLVGTSARFRMKGPDLHAAASRFGIERAPAQPYEAVGGIRVFHDHYVLEDVDASVGGLTVRADGTLGAPSPRSGTSLALKARGQTLSDLAAWGVPVKLPADPFAASGRVVVEQGVFRVEDATAELGADRLEVDGALGALPDLASLDVALTASGPSLAGAFRFAPAAGSALIARMPTEPFTIAGRVKRVPSGIELDGVKAGVGAARISASGVVGLEDRGIGTNLTFDAEAPDTSMISRAVGAPLPEGALQARGTIRRAADGLHLDATELTVGASYAQLTGTLGEPPRLEGTDVELSVEGPDLASMLSPWTGNAPLPSESFSVSAHVSGDRDRLASDRLQARLGANDLTGSVSLRLAGRPFLDADLKAKHLDVGNLIAGFTREPDAAAAPDAPAKKARDKRARLIPDWPLELRALGTFDARLALAAEEVPFLGIRVRDVAINGGLENGALTIDRAGGTGQNGGHATSSLSLRPDPDGYRLHTEGRFEGGRLELSKTGQSPELAPPLDVEYELEAAGRSLHDLAASADGRILVLLGPGRIPSSLTDVMTSGILIALLDALNPFRKSAPYTALECGVAAAGIDDGKMVVRPIAARTDKMTILGNGKLDLDTEDVDLAWTIKPRRGVGITGGSIANPYIKLGGTLANPSLDLKPLEAAASTGAAVATAGLTLLLRGIYDRITAEKKVCVDALAKARKQIDEREARKSAPPRE